MGRAEREGGLWHLAAQTAQGSSFCCPPPPRSLSSSSSGSSDHNAGVSPAPTGRVAAVCRQDVARLQEGKVTKWETIVLRAKQIRGQDSKEDEIIFIPDKSPLKQ